MVCPVTRKGKGSGMSTELNSRQGSGLQVCARPDVPWTSQSSPVGRLQGTETEANSCAAEVKGSTYLLHRREWERTASQGLELGCARGVPFRGTGGLPSSMDKSSRQESDGDEVRSGESISWRRLAELGERSGIVARASASSLASNCSLKGKAAGVAPYIELSSGSKSLAPPPAVIGLSAGQWPIGGELGWSLYMNPALSCTGLLCSQQTGSVSRYCNRTLPGPILRSLSWASGLAGQSVGVPLLWLPQWEELLVCDNWGDSEGWSPWPG